MIEVILAVHNVEVKTINRYFKEKAFLVRLAAANQNLLFVLLKGVDSVPAAIN